MLNSFAALLTGTSRVHTDLDWDTVTAQLGLMTFAYLQAAPPAPSSVRGGGDLQHPLGDLVEALLIEPVGRS